MADKVMKKSFLTKFNNALYQGEDPHVTLHNGYYYLVASSNVGADNKIYVSKSSTLLYKGETKVVFSMDDGTQSHLFAPEMFYIDGKWYIYYHAWCHDKDAVDPCGRKLAGTRCGYVLEAKTDDPQGEYYPPKLLYTGVNGVIYNVNDLTVFKYQGKLYAAWQTFKGDFDESDPNLYWGIVMAEMDSPTKITKDRFIPGLKGGEGPRPIIKDGRLYMTSSHGAFACSDYCISMDTLKEGGDIKNPADWTYNGIVMRGTGGKGGDPGTGDVYGVGRSSFVKSKDGTEDWMVYHTKVYASEENWWRQVRIKKFTWDENGPVFGVPESPKEFIDLPSGDPGVGDVYQAEEAELLGDAVILNDKRGFQGEGFVKISKNKGSGLRFTIEVEEAGDYFITSRYAYGEKVEGEYDSHPKVAIPKRGSMTIVVNDSQKYKAVYDKTNIDWESWMYNGNRITLNKGVNTIIYNVEDGDSGNIQIDYIGVQKM